MAQQTVLCEDALNTVPLTLLKLKTMKGADGKPLKIIQKIAAHDYTTFGMCLLQDENGEEVALLKKNHIHDGAESVTQAILQKWLQSNAPTRTYQHLIQCLRQSELGALAEVIENAQGPLSFPSVPQETITIPVTPSSSIKQVSSSDPLSSYATYLKGLYTSMTQSDTSQHWTHLPRCEFIQLAMITSKEQRRGDREEETVRLEQQGKIETIMSNKKAIDLDNLFISSDSPDPRVILIEGAPGGGKSTLVLHICHLWAQYAPFLGRFDIVVLVYLRDQAVHDATKLADILPARTSEMSQIVASQMQAFTGHKVLFVFDGWDEFPSHLQNDSLVSTIIRQPHKLSLHQSTILITSRPVSSEILLSIANRRVEILGFTQHQIREYIEKALDGSSSHIQKLVQHLEEHPVIEGYCYIPLHVAILVHIFLTMKGALPTTLHELFCSLVLCCIARELETHESDKAIDISNVLSLDDLTDFKSELNDLCILAYEGVMQNKVVFYQKDLQAFNLSFNLPSLGLLQAVEGLTLLSKSCSYNFLHLSVQELLAAYHISHMDPSKQMEAFRGMLEGSRLQAVLHYYSGFTKLADPMIQEYITSYSQQFSHITKLLPLLHCFFEAQKPSLCRLVKPPAKNCIDMQLFCLSPVDCLAVCYYIASFLSEFSSNVLLKIDAHLGEHNLMKLKLLLLELSKPAISALLTKIAIEIKVKFLKENSAVLIKYLNSLPISRLHLILPDKSTILATSNIFKLLKHNTTLVYLKLGSTRIATTEVAYIVQALTEILQVNKTLLHLDIADSLVFTADSAQRIFHALQCNSTLLYLNLSHTFLTGMENVTAEALTVMLKVNKTLTKLDLSRNVLTTCAFRCLQHNNTLVDLNLSDTALTATKDNGQALIEMLKEKTLKHLDLSNNEFFSDSGAFCVYVGLQHNATLVSLNLSTTGITDKGAEIVAQALYINQSLQTLNVARNSITDNGYTFIAKSLRTNTTLRTLDIQYNLITKNAVETAETNSQVKIVHFCKPEALCFLLSQKNSHN